MSLSIMTLMSGGFEHFAVCVAESSNKNPPFYPLIKLDILFQVGVQWLLNVSGRTIQRGMNVYAFPSQCK